MGLVKTHDIAFAYHTSAAARFRVTHHPGVFTEGPWKSWDFVEPYLRKILSFIKNCMPGFGSKSRFQRSPRHSTVTDNIVYRQIGFATLTSLSAHFAMILA